MPLRTAVADIGGVETAGRAALLINAAANMLGQLVQMNAAGMAVAEYILNEDLLLSQPEPSCRASSCAQSLRSASLLSAMGNNLRVYISSGI